MNNFLDYTGLSYFLNKLRLSFGHEKNVVVVGSNGPTSYDDFTYDNSSKELKISSGKIQYDAIEECIKFNFQ